MTIAVLVKSRCSLAVSGLFWLATALPAQAQVLHVGGPTPDHADLPPAVAAAAPGAILIVHPGTYTGFTTSKPLRVLLDFGPGAGTVQAAPGSAYAIRVTGLPFGTQFLLVGRGANVARGTLGAIRLDADYGTVFVQGISATAGNGIALDVQNAASVIVQECYLVGAPALLAQSTALVSTGAVFVGDASGAHNGVVLDSAGFEGTLGAYLGNLAPAVRATNSELSLAGDGSTTIKVGGQAVVPISALEVIASDLRWQASHFVLQPALGAPGLGAYASNVVVEPQTALVAHGAPPGGTATVSVTCPTPVPGVLVLGGLGQPSGVAGLNGIYLDPLLPNSTIALGQIGPVGLQWQTTVPPGPSLFGFAFSLQTILLRPNGALQRQAPGVWAIL